MAEPSISVVIPAKDARATVAAAVRSALEQQSPPLEVIVVDDGSSDGTAAAAADAGARVVPGPGAGVAAARNAGLEAARGAWAGFLDADDRWLPTLLGSAIAAIDRRPGCVACFAAATPIDDDGQQVGRHSAPADIGFDDLLHGRVVPTTSATLVDRAVATRIGGFHPGFRRAAGVEDLDLWLRIALEGPCVGVPEPQAVYVVHDTRDARRTEAELADLAADRELVIDRIEARTARRQRVGRSTMRARTARYWLRAGFAVHALRAAIGAVVVAPTPEELATLGLAGVPAPLRRRLIDLRRRRRSGR